MYADPVAIKYLFVVCADCGAEIDRLEYDAGAEAPAVVAVADALGVDTDQARKLVAKQNPGAELTNEANTRNLADQITAGTVNGYPDQACPASPDHTGLEVSEDNPTPVVVTRIAKVSAR